MRNLLWFTRSVFFSYKEREIGKNIDFLKFRNQHSRIYSANLLLWYFWANWLNWLIEWYKNAYSLFRTPPHFVKAISFTRAEYVAYVQNGPRNQLDNLINTNQLHVHGINIPIATIIFVRPGDIVQTCWDLVL